MRWFSKTGEFAFVSFGGTARGIIAIGGVTHGVISIGAFGSVGVISLGMNAAGSVAAVGMNAVGPISISLINGLGIYTRAGVNGWGAWSHAGTNSWGLSSQGGVNSDHSVLPAAVFLVLVAVLSFIVPGKRQRRESDTAIQLRELVHSPESRADIVRARLRAVRDGVVELDDRSERVEARVDESVLAQARAFLDTAKGKFPWVMASLARVEESIPVGGVSGYRERPEEKQNVFIRCSSIELASEPQSWLPGDMREVQWVIAWTARIAVVAAIILIWLA